MQKNGLNFENIKINNRKTILKLLNDFGGLSRKEIAKKSGLTQASVTQICNEMLQDKIIEEKGEKSPSHKAGRREILIDIDYESKIALSVNIEKYTTFITLANFKGDVLKEEVIKTDKSISPFEFLSYVAKICQKFISETKVKIEGIGVSSRGIVDSESGKSINSYEIWEEQVDVKGILENILNLPVCVDNNLRAFAQAEIIFGMGRTTSNLLFLKWFPGVGSSMVIDKKVYVGSGGSVAEMGHFIVDERGERCRCGKTGCLETIASTSSIISSIQKIYSHQNTPILFEKTKGDENKILVEIKRQIKNNDTSLDDFVKEIFLRAVEKIALAVSNSITMLSPEKIVLFGEFFESEWLLKEFKIKCENFIGKSCSSKIFKSKLSKKYSYIGGLALVMEKIFFSRGGM